MENEIILELSLSSDHDNRLAEMFAVLSLVTGTNEEDDRGSQEVDADQLKRVRRLFFDGGIKDGIEQLVAHEDSTEETSRSQNFQTRESFTNTSAEGDLEVVEMEKKAQVTDEQEDRKSNLKNKINNTIKENNSKR